MSRSWPHGSGEPNLSRIGAHPFGAPAKVIRAFTLIELLVVISIIAVLISILLPALGKAREEAKKMHCMSNMRQIGAAVASYLNDHDNLPWTYIHRVAADGTLELYPGSNWYSSFTWGGMRAPLPEHFDSDYHLVPAELRPLNKFLAPTARDDDVIKVVQCPGDRSAFIPVYGQEQEPLEIEGPKKAWEEVGTSYGINWAFTRDPDVRADDDWLGGAPLYVNLMRMGKKLIGLNVGGDAAEFVVITEVQTGQLFVGVFQNNGAGGRLGEGWHRKFGYHTFLFLDGHVEHRFFDTRFPQGPGWRIRMRARRMN